VAQQLFEQAFAGIVRQFNWRMAASSKTPAPAWNDWENFMSVTTSYAAMPICFCFLLPYLGVLFYVMRVFSSKG
jgi:hypothetical protein